MVHTSARYSRCEQMPTWRLSRGIKARDCCAWPWAGYLALQNRAADEVW
jgi:hypothetical protein